MNLRFMRPTAVFLAAGLLLESASPAHALFGFGKKQPPPPTPVAAVGSIEGKALYQAKGAGDWVPLSVGQKLQPTDSVKTEGGGKVVVAFSDGSKIQVGENAVFTLQALEPKSIGVKIGLGAIEAWVAKVRKRRFTVRSPTAVASVRGTHLGMNVDASGHTECFCFTGSVDVGNNFGQATRVEAGQIVQADTAGKVTEPAPIPPTIVPTPEPVVIIPPPAPPEALSGAVTKEAAPAPTEPAPTEPAPTEPEPAPTEPEPAPTEPEPAPTEPPPPPPPNPNQDTQTVSPTQ